MSFLLPLIKNLKPKKIRTQLILGTVLVYVVLMGFFVFGLINKQKQFLKQQSYAQTISFVSSYAINATADLIANNFDGLERLTTAHRHQPHLKYAMILSPEGTVLAHTTRNYIGSKATDSISLRLNHATTTQTLIANDELLDIAVPVFADEKIIGWARAGVSQQYINNNLSAIIREGLLYILIALIAVISLSVFFGNFLSRGLYNLVNVAEEISNGNSRLRATPYSSKELSKLSTAFNKMLDKIGAKEQLLQMMIENMPVGIRVFDENGAITSANATARQIWFDAEQADISAFHLYKGWFAETGKKIEPHEWGEARALTKGESVVNEELEIETPGQRRKIILNSAIPLKGTDDRIIGALAINVDITDRKKITEQLAVSESTLRSAFEHAPVGKALMSPDGKWMRVNRALCEMVGYTEEEMLATSYQNITHPDDLETNLSCVKQILAGERDSFRMEKRYLHKNGHYIWIDLSVSLVRDASRQPLFFVGHIEDITAKKQTLTQLALSESTLRGAFEYSAVGMSIVSLDGTFIKVNPALCNMLGYTETELLQMTFADITHPDTIQHDLAFARHAKDHSAHTYRTEKKYLHKNGSIVWANINSSVIKNEKGEPLYLITQIEDITEKKEADLKFQTLVEKTMIGVFMLQNGRFVYVNPRFAEKLGYTPAELLNLESALEVVYPDDRDIAVEQWQKRSAGAKDIYVELRYKKKNGGFIWAEINSTEIYLKGQKAIIGTLHNITERKKNEVLLKEQAETFEAIIENTKEAIFLIAPDYKLLQFNKTAKERILANTGKEIHTGCDFRAFLYPDPQDAFYAMFRDALEGRSRKDEFSLLTAAGKRIWVETKTSPVYDRHGLLIGVTMLAERIDDRKQAEHTILQFSRLYQFTSAINEMMLHAESKEAIFSNVCQIAIDQGNFRMAWIGYPPANAGAIQMVAWAGHNEGYLDSVKILVGDNRYGKGPTGTAIKTREICVCNNIDTDPMMDPWREEALKRGYRSSISLPVVIGQRLEAVFTLYMSEPDFFSEKEVRLLQNVTSNIAFAIEKIEIRELQQKAERELKESEEKFRQLVEETRVGVFIMQDKKFVYVNPQFERMTGYNRTEVIGKLSIEQLVHQNDLEKVWQHYILRMSGQVPSDHYTFKAVTKSGEVRQLEIISSFIHYNGEPATIGSIIDVTERVAEEKRISKAVSDAQERERQQISMELHDNVKQIMAASLLNIDFMRSNIEDVQLSLQIINKVKTYVSEAIEELRRISHRLAPSVDETVPLEEKIKTVVSTMNVSKNLNVHYNFDPFKKPLRDDVQLALYRILQEQFSNILKYAGASAVNIGVKRCNGDLCMTIEDNGVGFDTGEQKSGIGLENISRRVQVLNGKMHIRSAPGKGCTLEVKIPVAGH